MDWLEPGGSGAGQGPPIPEDPKAREARESHEEFLAFEAEQRQAWFNESFDNATKKTLGFFIDPFVNTAGAPTSEAEALASPKSQTAGEFAVAVAAFVSPAKVGNVLGKGGFLGRVVKGALFGAGAGATVGVGGQAFGDVLEGEVSPVEDYGRAAGVGAVGGAIVGGLTGAISGAQKWLGSERPGPTVASSGDDVADAAIIRDIAHGERVKDLVNEVGQLTAKTELEHGIVTLADGRRVIVSGGSGGIDFGKLDVRRILLHSHPPGSAPGPSPEDFAAIDYYFQRSSWLLEVEKGLPDVLKRFRVSEQP